MWLLLAMAASVCWGISYVTFEQIFKHISVYTALSVQMFIISIVIGIFAVRAGTLHKDLFSVISSPRLLLLMIVGAIAWTIAELAIGFSITEKNATLSGFVEISYPFFIALFAYLFVGEQELSVGTGIGGFLIFLGVSCIYYFSR